GLDLDALEDEAEKAASKQASEEFAELVQSIRAALGDAVKDVRITQRLTDSASCLVSDEGEISGHLERLLRQAGQKAPPRKPILEINPRHPLLARARTDSERIEDWSRLLLDQAVLAEGG